MSASGKKIHFAKVDCTVERDVCTSLDVKGYPTLMVHTGEGEPFRYNGGREAKDLKEHVLSL